MKIAFAIHSWKPEEVLEFREKKCLESLRNLKIQCPNIDIVNISFKDDLIEYKDFTSLAELEVNSIEVIKEYFSHEGLKKEYLEYEKLLDSNNRRYASVNEMFDILSKRYEKFIMFNSDIIVSSKIIDNIDLSLDGWFFSKVHLNKFDENSTTVEMESYSVHGFDGAGFDSRAWNKVKNNYSHLFLGVPYWDTYFYSKSKLLLDVQTCNKQPPLIYHMEHNSSAMDRSISTIYAENIFARDIATSAYWNRYVEDVLLRRDSKENVKWFTPLPNEEVLEQLYFNDCKNHRIQINEQIEWKPPEKNKDFDIFIPSIHKDFTKLPFVIDSCLEYTEAKNILVCSPDKAPSSFTLDSKVTWINDLEVLNYDKSKLSFRPNWMYQQFLKMFQDVSPNDWFLTIDSDTILLKKMNMFQDDKPIWRFGWEQNHFPYFRFMKNVFGVDKVVPHTSISDIGFFNKGMTKSFLEYCNSESVGSLLDKIGDKMNPLFHFSEFETYSNFCESYYKLYTFKRLQQMNDGKNLDENSNNWTESEIRKKIKDAGDNFDTLHIHSWKI